MDKHPKQPLQQCVKRVDRHSTHPATYLNFIDDRSLNRLLWQCICFYLQQLYLRHLIIDLPVLVLFLVAVMIFSVRAISGTGTNISVLTYSMCVL